MKYTAATTVFLKIAQTGKNYFPDIQKISGKKITVVNVMTDMVPLYGGDIINTPTEGIASSLNLTENGTDYFLQDANLMLFIPQLNKGINIPIGRQISVMDCYVNIAEPNYVGLTMVIVFWYETELYSQPRKGTSYYDSFDVPVNLDTPVVNNYFPDIRTLADKSFEGIFLNYPTVTPNFQAGITPQDANRLYVTFAKGSYAVLDAVPLPLLYQTANYERMDFRGIVFDFESSFIQAAAASPSAGLAMKHVNFTVKYR